ncbi:hypothetical protein [Rhodohalobacter halophilus]|uniref:hypothetical protein n=1 Tax=Rhodohalobacter halophilus TaxID=1812810 RepID=UPI00083FB83E|nr:hypothetical protein [Rhodohalobacter halophilus]
MPITKQQEIRVQNWLNERAPNSTCTMCGSKKWIIGDILAPTVTFHGKSVDISGDSRPMVQVICGKCAKVNLFDASMIGLI